MRKTSLSGLIHTRLSISKFFFGLLFVLGLVLLFQTGRFFWENRDVSRQNLSIITNDVFISGGHGSAQLRLEPIVDYLSDKNTDVGNARIRISLKAKDKKDAKESMLLEQDFKERDVVVDFRVPELPIGGYVLDFEVRSNLGKDKISKQIIIAQSRKLIISTDRPLYKPGQELLYRAMLLDKTNLKPVKDQPIQIIISNPKGDKIMKKELISSEYGIVSGSFPFASELAFGDYSIQALAGEDESTKVVSVKDFVLPEYEVKVETDQDIAVPQETISGTVSSNYYFGKPLAGAEAVVSLDSGAIKMEQRGQTDGKGGFRFEFSDPRLKQAGRISISAAVSEGAKPAVLGELSAQVNSEPIIIELIPESGKLKPGLENNIVLVASDANNNPIRANIVMTGERLREFATNEFGIASFSYVPDRGAGQASFRLRVSDENGHVIDREFFLESEFWKEDQIIVRTDRAYYQDEQALKISVSANDDMPVRIEVVQDKYVLSSRNLDLKEAKGELEIPITENMFGLLEVRASAYPDRSGEKSVATDRKLVVVDKANDLDLNISSDKESYRPGDEARFTVEVKNKEGKGENAALAIKVLDEALLALQDEDVFSRSLLMIDAASQEYMRQFNGLSWDELREQEASASKELILQAMLSRVPSYETELVEISKDNSARYRNFNENREKYVVWGLVIFVVFFLWNLIGLWRAAGRNDRGEERLFLPTVSIVAIALFYAIIWNIITGGDFLRALQLIGEMFSFSRGFFDVISDVANMDIILLPVLGLVLYAMVRYKPVIGADFAIFVKRYFFSLLLLSFFAALGRSDLLSDADAYRYFYDIILVTGLASAVLSLFYLILPRTMRDGSSSVLTWLSYGVIGLLFLPFFAFLPYLFAIIVLIALIDGMKEAVNGDHTYSIERIKRNMMDAGMSDDEIAKAMQRINDGEDVDDLDFAGPRVLPSLIRIVGGIILLSFIFLFFADHDYGPHSDPRMIAANIIRLVLSASAIFSIVFFLWSIVLMNVRRGRNAWIIRKRGRIYFTISFIFLFLIFALYALSSYTLDATFSAVDSGSVYRGGISEGMDVFDYSPNRKSSDMLWGGSAASESASLGTGLSDGPKLPSFLETKGSAEKAESEISEKKLITANDDGKIAFKPAERVRRLFPETMFWQPELIAENGKAEFVLPVHDSITRWKMSALANALSGKIGAGEKRFVSFQDFFLNFNLPANLSVGDEFVLPVEVFNYLDEAQKIKLLVRNDDWFSLSGAEQIIDLSPSEKKLLRLKLRIEKYGDFSLRIDAQGTKMSDAVEKTVRVQPLGRLIEQTVASEQMKEKGLEIQALFPKQRLAGTEKLSVKLYPTIFSQIVDGLEGLLKLPSGCFEQVSSSLFPNILVLDYLNKTGRDTPELRKRAEDFIGTGFQKVLTYEMPGGGFSLYGHGEAETVLSAYGLLELNSLKEVAYVDEQVIERTRQFLASLQERDGSFRIVGGHNGSLSSRSDLGKNAYVIWSLSESENDSFNLNKSFSYLADQYRAGAMSNYDLALTANAMHNIRPDDPKTKELLGVLKNKVQKGESGFYISMDRESHFGSSGNYGAVEVSALAAIVLGRAGEREHADKLLDYVISQKNGDGGWGSTQATVMALSALVDREKKDNASSNDNGKIAISLNGGEKREVSITPADADVIRLVDFSDALLDVNNLALSKEGEINTTLQVVKRYYESWDSLSIATSSGMSIKTAFISGGAETQDQLQQYSLNKLRLDLDTDTTLTNAMVDILVPSGFEVQSSGLKDYVSNESKYSIITSFDGVTWSDRIRPPITINLPSENFKLGRFEQSHGRLLLYFDWINPGASSIDIEMKPTYEGSFKLLPSRFYVFYDPSRESFSELSTIEVKP